MDAIEGWPFWGLIYVQHNVRLRCRSYWYGQCKTIWDKKQPVLNLWLKKNNFCYHRKDANTSPIVAVALVSLFWIFDNNSVSTLTWKTFTLPSVFNEWMQQCFRLLGICLIKLCWYTINSSSLVIGKRLNGVSCISVTAGIFHNFRILVVSERFCW